MFKGQPDMFMPKARSVLSLFSDADSFYRVPDYQRHYSWTHEEVLQLWEDVFQAMGDGQEAYFLGSMILIQSSDEEFLVVDGQQRLATLMVLFCVLRDLGFGGDGELKNAIQSLANGRYRLITHPEDQNTFEQEILRRVKFPSHRGSDETTKAHFLNAAHTFRECLQGKSESEIIRFREYLLKKVAVITIACGDESFAIRLFEVLNTRGLELTQADLIKGYLRGRCRNDQIAQFSATWREIERIAEDMEHTVTDVLTYYQYYKNPRVPKESLYKEFKETFREPEPNETVYDVHQFATCLRELYGDAGSKVIYSLRYLSNPFWRAILAAARRKEWEPVDRLTVALRRLYYSYWIAGYTVSSVRQVSFRLIELVKGGGSVDEIEATIEEKIKKDKVVERVEVELNNGVYGRPWLRPLLLLVEYEQTDNSRLEFIETDRKLHADHVLPEEWRKTEEWRKIWGEPEADMWLNKLGNLTLVSGSKNSAARHFSFAKKKEVYSKSHGGKTAFEISKKIIEKEGWFPADVRERHYWLVNQVASILALSLSGTLPGPGGPAIPS